MEAHVYLKEGIRQPYATETPQSAHILAPILHITFPAGLSLEEAIANATAVSTTTGMNEIAQERSFLQSIKQDPTYKGTRPIPQSWVGSIKLADDQLKTETNPEKREELEQRRNIALAQIVTEFYEHFNA